MSTRHDWAIRVALRWTLWSLLAFLVAYGWGALMVSNWDINDVCEISREQNYDSLTAEQRYTFPLKNTCNADYSLLPTYVNPLIGITGGVLLIFVACLVAAFIRRENLHSSS